MKLELNQFYILKRNKNSIIAIYPFFDDVITDYCCLVLDFEKKLQLKIGYIDLFNNLLEFDGDTSYYKQKFIEQIFVNWENGTAVSPSDYWK